MQNLRKQQTVQNPEIFTNFKNPPGGKFLVKKEHISRAFLEFISNNILQHNCTYNKTS